MGPPLPRDEWLVDALELVELDRAALVERVGAPGRVTSWPQPNRHDPTKTDSIVALEYDDARFVYYVVSAGPYDLLDFAEVRSNAYLRRMPPGIGTPADSLPAWWGAPVSRTDSTLEYDCLTCEVPQPTTFVVRGDTIAAIRFDLYVD